MKLILAMAFAPILALAANFPVRTLPQVSDPLEPSLQNEVDHAIDLAELWLAKHAPTNRTAAATNVCPRVALRGYDGARELFATNGLSHAQIALRFISGQKGAGWWVTSTNALPTRLAVDILKGL